jgi:hypothetical protein
LAWFGSGIEALGVIWVGAAEAPAPVGVPQREQKSAPEGRGVRQVTQAASGGMNHNLGPSPGVG